MTSMRNTTARDAVRPLIEDALRRQMLTRTARAASYGSEYAELWRLTADRALGGKLIRPMLLVDVFQDFGAGEPQDVSLESAVEVATTVELLHFGFLLHDDVIDGDTMRRGRSNLIGALAHLADDAGAEQSLHWGRTGAILMGDLLLTASVLDFARADLPAATRARLLDLLEHVIVETVVGEHTDVGFSDGVIAAELPRILEMTTRKTAAYSFELPLRAAAILVDAPAAAESALAAIGRSLGLAYQLQDDLLSTFGDPGLHGKDAFSDLREGKETAIIAYARMTRFWPAIARTFGMDDLSVADGVAIRELLRRSGAEEYVRNLVDEQIGAARDAILDDTTPLTPDVRRTLLDLTAGIEGRRS